MARKALLIEANCFDENYDVVKHKILLPNPIAGAIKITNGKISCKLMINEDGVELFLLDDEGHVERWKSEKVGIKRRF